MSNILDNVISTLLKRISLFDDGWGNRNLLERIHKTSRLFLSKELSLEITWNREYALGSARIRSGKFSSLPQEWKIPIPEECRQGYLELILPPNANPDTPICIHFAGTGDEGVARRRWFMAIPLLKYGIGSVILENLYYGRRRPKGQVKYGLRRVEDLWAMAAGTVEEGRALVNWLSNNGFRRIGVTGISMGGFMAAAVGSLVRKPLAIIPCLSPHSGASVFTRGPLAGACSWKLLNQEMKENRSARSHLRKLLEVTDIRTLAPPLDLKGTILVSARNDGIVSPSSTRILHKHWKGAELRWVDTGHAGAFLFYRQAFIQAISDAFKRAG